MDILDHSTFLEAGSVKRANKIVIPNPCSSQSVSEQSCTSDRLFVWESFAVQTRLNWVTDRSVNNCYKQLYLSSDRAKITGEPDVAFEQTFTVFFVAIKSADKNVRSVYHLHYADNDNRSYEISSHGKRVNNQSITQNMSLLWKGAYYQWRNF